MKFYQLFTTGLLYLLSMQACAQPEQKVGGPCEGCEAIYENTTAFEKLPASDTMPGYRANGRTLLISGTVYKADGKTPAPDIVLYLYQTNEAGIYATKGNEKGWARRHGYLRTWLKTGKDGTYSFWTIRPGSYPNSNNPQHIHITIKEPGKSAYWIDEFHFDDDPLLTEAARKLFENRGGSGIITPQKEGSVYRGRRDIILGKNIPGY